MTATVVLAAVALGAALIERASSTDSKRWRLVRGWLAAEGLGLAALAVICLASRGFSKSSLAIAVGVAFWLGAGFLLLNEVRVGATVVEQGRAIAFRAAPRYGTQVQFRRARAWCLSTVVIAIGPLQYAGALVAAPVMSKVAAVLTVGQLKPLNPRAPLRVGQCLKVRAPNLRNVTGPCGLPHQAQVVSALNTAEPCPDLAEFDTQGRDLELIRAELTDDVAYCLVRPRHPTEFLSEAIFRKGLAPTL